MPTCLRYRVKDKHAAELARQAKAVNFVWNFCNQTQRTAIERGAKWPTWFGLVALTAETSRDLGLSGGTIGQVCQRYFRARRQSRRRLLRWRGRKSLGWVPIRKDGIRATDSGIRFRGVNYSVWMSRPLEGTILDGSSFSCDSRGRWYLNLIIETTDAPAREVRSMVGVDLGLKDFAVLSTGESIPAPQHFRVSEDALAVAQRSGNKRRTRAIHAKVAAQRRDFHHKLSTRLVREFDMIVVGDVGRGLVRTGMAKSAHDAGWSQFRRQLSYKAIALGATYKEVREHLTTQTCSDCGFVGGPKGREGLVMREWACQACGSVHDRDVNAARNILGLGHEARADGISARQG